MIEVVEGMIKRRVVLADGRYLIFYTFAPSGSRVPSPLADAEKAPQDKESAEEK